MQRIDNETLALQMYAITFDAVPPGHAPSIKKPSVISFEKLKILQIVIANTGIIVNCRKIVNTIKEGFFRTALTSFKFRVVPIPNITKPSKKGIVDLKCEKKS